MLCDGLLSSSLLSQIRISYSFQDAKLSQLIAADPLVELRAEDKKVPETFKKIIFPLELHYFLTK